MKQTFTLLLFLVLLSSSAAYAQKAVLLQSFEESTMNADYPLAEENLFINKRSNFEVYNLLTGNFYTIPKALSPYLSTNYSIGTVGKEVVFSANDGNTYRTQGSQSLLLFDQLRSTAICTGKNYTVVVLATPDNSSTKVVAINKVTKVITTLLELGRREYGTQATYYEKEDKVYLSLNMEHNRTTIYVTDGTREGTSIRMDINPTNYSFLENQHFINNGEEIYYAVVERSADGSLIKTNFYVVKDSQNVSFDPISSVSKGFYDGQIYARNDVIYGYDQSSQQLFRTESAATKEYYHVLDFYSFLGEFNSNIVFTASNSYNSKGDTLLVSLFMTNGTSGGTSKIAENVDFHFKKNAVKEHKGNLYFFKEDEIHGRELWRFDGNKSYLVEDIIPGLEGLYNPQFFTFNDELYFTALLTQESNKLNLYKLTENASSIKISSYADYNSNNIKDPEEPFITNVFYSVAPKDLTILTSENISNINLENGTYTFTASAGKGWEHTSTTNKVTITLPEDNGKSYSFGLKPLQTTTKVDASFMSEASRCGFPTPYTLHYSNSGYTKASGTIKLKPEKKFAYTSASPAPNRISGDTLIWNINDLEIGRKGKITINFTMPGVEHMGDTLNSKLFTNFKSAVNSSTHADTSALQQILTCSYDPNDIQVNPAGEGKKHLTLKKKKLEYLIRFQNMGTDKAFNIVVTNELQQELDLSTFEIIGSSHDMYTEMDGNQVKFHFDNIHLPDDKTDEPGSHGYILYSIKPKAGLPDSTIIHNKASIYFDYNPAIETNITFNTLVERLPAKAVLEVGDELAEAALTLYPNPAEDQLYISWPAGRSPYTLYSLINSQGQQVKQAEFKTGLVHQLNVASLPAGLYFLRAIRQDRTSVRKVFIR